MRDNCVTLCHGKILKCNRILSLSISYLPLSQNWLKLIKTWHLTLSTWHLAPGTWHLEPDTWDLPTGIGTWNLRTCAPGTWHPKPGICTSETWSLAPAFGTCQTYIFSRSVILSYKYISNQKASTRGILRKKVFLEISQNSLETPVPESLF